jgi:hypothetical protein
MNARTVCVNVRDEVLPDSCEPVVSVTTTLLEGCRLRATAKDAGADPLDSEVLFSIMDTVTAYAISCMHAPALFW